MFEQLKRPIIIFIFAAIVIIGGIFIVSYILEQEQQVETNTNQANSPGTSATIEEQLVAQSTIKKFNDYDELKEFLEAGAFDTFSYDGMAKMAPGVMIETMDSTSAQGINLGLEFAGEIGLGRGGGAAEDYSETNVQVEGVDEADIIKNDGQYVYALVKNDLFIIDAYPAEGAEILSKIEFKDRPQDIYINGDSLIVFGYNYEIYNKDYYNRFRRHGSYTFFKVFDISDRSNPDQVRNLDFEGSYTNSRMIGDYVYFITTNYSYYYLEDEQILPRIIDDGEVLANTCSNQAGCIMPDVYYFDIPYDSYNFTSVMAVNVVDNNEPLNGDVYLMSHNQDMYVSLDNIYITYTKYLSEYQLEMEVMKEIVYPLLSQKDRDKITNIESVENYILNPSEKMSKISQIVERYIANLTDDEIEDLEEEIEERMKQKYEDISKELEKTVIHKIGVDGNDLEYKASGDVTGHVLNQFSMDERDGYFRIATTKNRTWSQYEEEQQLSYNNLYVLDEDLNVVGAVEGLAEDEMIYSVRFMQNRAYLVTFKQMDPLFVIDLTNPKKPQVLGELKIPGFSNYLHPYDDNLLIGIGKETGENEWGGVTTQGLKFSLFDVSDVTNPKEVDVYIMGDTGSDSIALDDHKAFLFSKDKNLLSIPVSIRESTDGMSYGKLTFSGAAVFSIDESGFTLKGQIDHSDGGVLSDSDYWGGYQYYDNTVKRSLYMDDVLYTFSNNYLMMNNLDDLDQINKLELIKEKQEDYEIIN